MQKKKKRRIIIIATIVAIIIIVLSIIRNNLSPSQKSSENVVKNEITQVEDKSNELIIKKLRDMKERDRMEYYFGVFLEYIEDGDYEKAYNLLNENFKNNYFKTLEDFKVYCKKTFSDMQNIKHTNIERNGDVYVLWIEINDMINGNPNDNKEMNIVIKENDYYDFEMSFSVI